MEQFIFEEGKDGFFDDLISYIISVSSIGSSLELQNYNHAKKWVYSEKLVLEPGRVFNNFQIYTFPSFILDDIIKDKWPNKIIFYKEKIDKSEIINPINITCLKKLNGLLIQSSFVQYFENHKNLIITKFGENVNWPSIWNFARVIRNAFAHGGLINIKNINSPKVVWHNLEYDYNSNGKTILHNDMSAFELFYLMKDMDKHVD